MPRSTQYAASHFCELLPPLVTERPQVWSAILQFFVAEIRNPNTRRAYLHGAGTFFGYVGSCVGTNRLEDITSLHVAGWIDHMQARGLSAPTIKLRLAGLRMLFEALVRRQILPANPASVVRGPKHSVAKGKTPVLGSDETMQLLNSIDATTLIGLRDRAMIATMAYSFARIGAVTRLKIEHIFRQKRRLWLRLMEKGGKSHDIPCHHVLESHIAEWLEGAGHGADPSAYLFQTFSTSGTRQSRNRPLSGRPMSQSMTWEMLQRRARAAGIETKICNHTFRATGITAYLSNGGTIERAAIIAGHVSTRTTQLYDRRPDDVTLDEIEKIRFA
jgi:site-specific recombinase XerD